MQRNSGTILFVKEDKEQQNTWCNFVGIIAPNETTGPQLLLSHPLLQVTAFVKPGPWYVVQFNTVSPFPSADEVGQRSLSLARMRQLK